MNYYEFSRINLHASETSRFKNVTPSDVSQINQDLRYRGFVNCTAAQGDDSFVMFTNADDVVAGHYMYIGPASFETGTLKLWSHLARKSKWIHDIGAFTGVFALAAVTANPDCRVMAFEPSFVTYSRLLVNIHANGFDGHIAPIRCGLGSSLTELELRHPSGVYVMASGESFLESQISDPWFTEKVPVLSLDHLLADQDRYRRQIVVETQFDGANLVKIDVEGFENEVIKGMRETIERDRPTVIVEILDDESIPETLALFGPGYRVRHIDESNGRLADMPEGRNKLFIHDDKLHLLNDYPGNPA